MEKYIKDGIRDLFEVLSVSLYFLVTNSYHTAMQERQKGIWFSILIYIIFVLWRQYCGCNQFKRWGKGNEIRKIIVAVVCVFWSHSSFDALKCMPSGIKSSGLKFRSLWFSLEMLVFLGHNIHFLIVKGSKF